MRILITFIENNCTCTQNISYILNQVICHMQDSKKIYQDDHNLYLRECHIYYWCEWSMKCSTWKKGELMQ